MGLKGTSLWLYNLSSVNDIDTFWQVLEFARQAYSANRVYALWDSRLGCSCRNARRVFLNGYLRLYRVAIQHDAMLGWVERCAL